MEIKKTNVHIEQVKECIASQFVLEQDINLSETRPDMASICMRRAQLVVEEIRPYTDVVQVKGNLEYAILYQTEGDGCKLERLEGALPFEETIHMQGVSAGDTVKADSVVEDFSVSVINSRKLSVQSVITMNVCTKELGSVEFPTDMAGLENYEYRQAMSDVTQLALSKNDIFRMKQEKKLTGEYPNIHNILWQSGRISELDTRPMADKLMIQGELVLFVLYECEGENHEVRFYECIIPFSGNLECMGMDSDMTADVRWKMGSFQLSVKPDEDGEERVLQLDMSLQLEIKAYKEMQLRYIGDLYSVKSQVTLETEKKNIPRLLARVTGKYKMTEQMDTGILPGTILQLLHSEGNVHIDRVESVAEGTLVSGSVSVQILCVTGDDVQPYEMLEKVIPYSYVLECGDMAGMPVPEVTAELEKLEVSLADDGQVALKAVISFYMIAFGNEEVNLVKSITESEIDREELMRLPGMAIFVAGKGDTLWDIGKKYYISVDMLQQINELESRELTEGQRLLVVKQGM
ncbi:MAG: DUF3794 domain-containing protein [Lachnospiraceae bacterium]|nr:DUF3794 domain-containing protein [Lachnospiraceae bacterium]